LDECQDNEGLMTYKQEAIAGTTLAALTATITGLIVSHI